MNHTDEETVEELAKITQALEQNREFCQVAAQSAATPALKNLFRARAQQREQYIAELNRAVAGTDLAEDTQDEPSGALQRGLTTFTSAMAIEDWRTDKIVLKDYQEQEAKLLEAYQEKLDEDLAAPVERILQRQFEEIQTGHSFVNARVGSADVHSVLALFADSKTASHAVSLLEQAGVSKDRISILARNDAVADLLEPNKGEMTRDSAGAGALGGAAVGGLLGLLAGASTLLIPGGGLLLASGALASALGITAAGAAFGASSGAFFGALLGYGIAEEDSHRYVNGVKEGEILLVAQTTAEQARRIVPLLEEAQGQAVTVRDEQLLEPESSER